MNKQINAVTFALQVLTCVLAAGWAYTSHMNDCFNIGPCSGDVGLWIRLRDVAFYSFVVSLTALIACTAFHSMRLVSPWSKAIAWLPSLTLPPAVLFAAHWLFNLGVSVSPV